MSTYEETQLDKIQRLLKARTRADGKARSGYEQNVATLRAQLATLLKTEDNSGGN